MVKYLISGRHKAVHEVLHEAAVRHVSFKPVEERTCKVASRRELNYGNISEVSLWYECGAAILIAKGVEEPRHCPGCGCKVVS